MSTEASLSMRVFVTGGSGLIGSRVVRRLCGSGRRVVCLLRSTSSIDRISDLTWERVDGDVHDAQAVRLGAKDCDAVIHLACPSAWNEIEAVGIEDSVTKGLANILENAEDRARIVYVSSLAAIGPSSREIPIQEEHLQSSSKQPGMAYAHAKRMAETLCREASAGGRHVVVVNPAETYGPQDERLVTAGNLVGLLRGPLTLVCRGGTCIAHVDDVAEGVVAAMENGLPGERYILGGENLDHAALARLALEIVGRKQPVVQVPNSLFRLFSRVAEIVGMSLPYHPNVVPYATRYWFADNAKARRELKVQFRSARETLRPTVNWLKQAGYV